MRILPPETQNHILNAVRSYFHISGYSFKDNYARVISGVEEGVFGWITVNSLLGNFNNKQLSHDKTIAALDLGGASTQVTFNPSTPPKENGYKIKINNVEYHLYTYSFLGYGADIAINSAIEWIIKNQNHVNYTISFGCFPIGYFEKYRYNSVEFLIAGSSEPNSCFNVAYSILNLDKNCKQCSINRIYFPGIESKISAFSLYYYVANFFEMSKWVDPFKFYDVGQGFCKLNYDQLKAKYSNNPNWNFITRYCFDTLYIYAILNGAYHIPERSPDINPVGDLNNVEIGWTMGAMINQILYPSYF